MSVGRRKSKNPQKCQWEDEIITQETNSQVQHKTTNISENIKYRSTRPSITRPSSPPHLFGVDIGGIENQHDVSGTSKYKNEDPIAKSGIQVSLSDQVEKSTLLNISKEKKQRTSPHNEMTVDEVMQNTRQATFGECNLCKISLKDWLSSVEHIQLHRPTFIPPCIGGNAYINQQPTCLICEKQYRDKSELVLHARTEHDITKAPYGCVLCGKVLPTLDMLQDHIDIKEITIRCPICSSVHSHEYELYAHLSQCLQTFHPHLKYLRCHICDHRLAVDDVANHMIQHSFHAHTFRPKKEKSSSPVSAMADRPIFLCEVCNGRFGTFDDFKDHLYRHLESKKFCPLCHLKGFIRADFIIRHLLLRCPRRNAEQFAFGTTIISLGKYYNRNFLEVLKDMQTYVPFQEGLHTWASVPVVQDFIKSFESFTKEELKKIPELSSSFQLGPGIATDIDLLSWLTDFERQLSSKLNSFDMINNAFPAMNFDVNELKAMKDNFKLGLKENRSTGKPIEIELGITEGQVVISSQDDAKVESLEKSKKMDHRPSLKYYEKKFTECGVRILPPFDLLRLKQLNDEALKLMEFNPVADHIKKNEFSHEHFLRLDWESQFLRKKKPFYVRENSEVKRFSPLYKGDRRVKLSNETETIDVQRLLAEARELNSS